MIDSTISDAKRRPIDLEPASAGRGGSHPPCAVAASDLIEPDLNKESRQQRTVSIPIAVNWRDDADRALVKRLRDLSWQAARYRNQMLRTRWAQAMGWRVAGSDDKNAASKQIRRAYKEELSGDAYSCAEQEVQALWTRHAKTVIAGAPLPECRTDASLSVSGKEKAADSGIRIERDGEWFVLALRAQAHTCEGGSWLRLRIAKGTRRDEFLGPLLQKFATWQTPVKKATVRIRPREIEVRLSYPITIPLASFGDRMATLGPLGKDGRFLLRTDLQTRDYTHEFAVMMRRKDDWDLIRRRCMMQAGRRKGHARRKRIVLAREDSFDSWLNNHLHTWSADIVNWCDSQGVGTINVVGLETLDWQAFKFNERLKYKAAELGIAIIEDEVDSSAGTERAIKGELRKRAKEQKRRRDAVRELADQLKE